MTDILTPEQVKDLRIESFIKRQAGNVVRLGKVADSHEALREQLDEAQDDMRVLTKTLETLAEHHHAYAKIRQHHPQEFSQCYFQSCYEPRAVLARPGVKRVMEEQDAKPSRHQDNN